MSNEQQLVSDLLVFINTGGRLSNKTIYTRSKIAHIKMAMDIDVVIGCHQQAGMFNFRATFPFQNDTTVFEFNFEFAAEPNVGIITTAAATAVETPTKPNRRKLMKHM